MSVNPIELFFKRQVRSIQRHLEKYTTQDKLDEIKRLLADRGITSITESEIYERLMGTPEAVAKQYTAILQELIKDNLEELQSAVALETSIQSLVAAVATAAKQDLQKTAVDAVATAVGLVQAGTDKIIDSAATAAKQDILKGVMDTVNTAVESLQDFNEELQEYEPLIVYEDDETLWAAIEISAGSYGATLSEEKTIVKKGLSSLKTVIAAGSYKYVGSKITYGSTQDWSAYTHICLFWYGGNSGLSINFRIKTTGSAYRKFIIVDDFTGWKRIVRELANGDLADVGAVDLSLVEILEFYGEPTAPFTFYIDRVIIDNMESQLGGPLVKLAELDSKLDDIIERTVFSVVASDTEIANHDALMELPYQTAYTKALEFFITLPGEYRIYFELASSEVDETAYIKIYKNGTAHPNGAEHSKAGTGYAPKLEDLHFDAGDLLQFYYKQTTGSGTDTVNLKLVKIGGTVGVTPTWESYAVV